MCIRDSCNPQGFGVLCSRDADLFGALGILYTSSIFPERFSEEYTITRTILGGQRYPDITQLDPQEVMQRVRKAHHAVLGTTADPIDQLHFTHKNAIPLYEVGHHRRQEYIEELRVRQSNLYLLGNHLNGVGVKDCIRNAEAIAQHINEHEPQ